MTTLRVVVDELVADSPGGIGRYAEELTRQLIAVAPAGCDVQGIASAFPQQTMDDLAARLPGIAGITRLPLAAPRALPRLAVGHLPRRRARHAPLARACSRRSASTIA